MTAPAARRGRNRDLRRGGNPPTGGGNPPSGNSVSPALAARRWLTITTYEPRVSVFALARQRARKRINSRAHRARKKLAKLDTVLCTVALDAERFDALHRFASLRECEVDDRDKVRSALDRIIDHGIGLLRLQAARQR